MTGQKRRSVLKTFGSLSLLGLAGCASSTGSDDEWPSGPVDLVLAYSPGGLADTLTRIVNPQFEDELGVDVNIRNVPGASTMRGYTEWLQADPDGYTLGYVGMPSQALRVQVGMGEDGVPYGEEDGIVSISEAGTMLVVQPDLGVEDFWDLQELYESGELTTIGNHALGGRQHLTLEILKNKGYLPWENIVDYSGSMAEAQAAFTRGEYPATIVTDGSLIEGEQQPVMHFGPVETEGDFGSDEDILDETIPGGHGVFGYTAPPGTPMEIRQKAADAWERALTAEETQGPASRAELTLDFFGGPEYMDERIDEMYSIDDEVIDVMKEAMDV